MVRAKKPPPVGYRVKAILDFCKDTGNQSDFRPVLLSIDKITVSNMRQKLLSALVSFENSSCDGTGLWSTQLIALDDTLCLMKDIRPPSQDPKENYR